MVNGLQGMLRPPDPDPPLRGLWGLLRQAVDPTTPGFFDRGVPGLVKGLVQNLQRNPIETVADFSPLGDAKAIGYDAPRAFGEGNTIGGMLALASAVPGIPGGISKRIKDAKRGVGDALDYAGHHSAPLRGDDYAPLHALDKIYPEDIYTDPNAFRYYGHGGDLEALDRRTIASLRRYRNRPDAEVDIYRAVPLDAPDVINPGDWVTPSAEYAAQHGEGVLGGDYKILRVTGKADDLWTDANSPYEFGYNPLALIGLLGTGALLRANSGDRER